jgi:predicted small metal-binding protein
MSKELTCNDVVAGCAFEASAQTEEELLAKVAAHARESHGLEEISPELAAKVKSAIKDR